MRYIKSQKNLKLMEKKRISNCLYKDVCNNECKDTCIRYLEVKYLLDESGIPETKQKLIQLEAGIDLQAFKRLDSIKRDIVYFVKGGNNLYITSAETGKDSS